MKKLVVKYPWLQLKKGQGFFVPCVNTAEIYEEGMKAAVSVRAFDAIAKVGVIEGRLGVLFARRLPRTASTNQS